MINNTYNINNNNNNNNNLKVTVILQFVFLCNHIISIPFVKLFCLAYCLCFHTHFVDVIYLHWISLEKTITIISIVPFHL